MSDRINQPRISSTVIASRFPTVFMLREFEGGEALNRKLADLMLRLEKETVNIAFRTTNIGGYHSEPNLFKRKEPELGSLRELIQQALDDYLPKFLVANCHVPPANLKMRLWGWGINMRAGDMNLLHVHPDAKVSGVYYVSVPPLPPGSALEEGSIMFVDPRPRAHMNRVPDQTTEITIIPKPGLLILFPSYYEHAVIPFAVPACALALLSTPIREVHKSAVSLASHRPRRSSHRQMDAAASSATDHNSSDTCCPCDHRRRSRGLYWA